MFEVLTRGYNEVQLSANGEVIRSNHSDTSSRQVFIFDTFVVKFDGSNKWQNKREIHFYENVLEEEDAQFFPKLLGHGTHNGETFLIQERVEHTEIPTEEDEDQFRYLETKYGIDDVGCRAASNTPWNKEGYVCNCAITKDGLKIFDIGISQHNWGDDEPSSSSSYSSYPYSSSPECDCSGCKEDDCEW